MWYVYFRRIVLTICSIFAGLLMVTGLFIINTFPVKADSRREELRFPFSIEGTSLVAEYFVSYEGDFFEDQSGEFLIDGSALCVYNSGDTHIEFASVYIETLDGVYCFEGTCIPPKSKVIILEKYKSSYTRSPVYFAAGRTLDTQKESAMDGLLIKPLDIGRIEVVNQGQEALKNILLYYKRYDSQWDIYIGGVTYAVSAGDLQAGESTIASPNNYANGYSKVLYATAE